MAVPFPSRVVARKKGGGGLLVLEAPLAPGVGVGDDVAGTVLDRSLHGIRRHAGGGEQRRCAVEQACALQGRQRGAVTIDQQGATRGSCGDYLTGRLAHRHGRRHLAPGRPEAGGGTEARVLGEVRLHVAGQRVRPQGVIPPDDLTGTEVAQEG